MPARGEDGSRQSFATQSVSLADHLVGVTGDLQLQDPAGVAAVYSEFIPKNSDALDLHFFFTSPL